VLGQKLLQLVGIEICEHFIAGHQGGDVRLLGQLSHLRISFAVPAYVDYVKSVTSLRKIILRVNAP